MGDAERDFHPSKKRSAGRELSRDNPGLDEDGPEPELGSFQRASEEVLAARRIVKVRRHQPPAVSSSSSNPFAGVCLVPLTDSNVKTTSSTPQLVNNKATPEKQDETMNKDDKANEDKGIDNGAAADVPKGAEESNKQFEKKTEGDGGDETTQPVEGDKEQEYKGQKTGMEAGEVMEKEAKEDCGKEVREKAEKEKGDDDQKETVERAAPLSSFQQLSSSENAFTGLVGTGFSSSSFTFGPIPKDGSAFGMIPGSLFGLNSGNSSSYPSFGIGSYNNGSSPSASNAMKEVPVETGEENDKVVFGDDAILFEYLDGGWKERGKGELKVNVSVVGGERARLVMRARGNYRLILNASLYPDMCLTDMDKRGITFACVNSGGEGKGGLATFALKFKDGAVKEVFRGAVTGHKGSKAGVLKMPENSPKASYD